MLTWVLRIMGYGSYIVTIIAVIHCITCKDCGSAWECIRIALGGAAVGTTALIAKPYTNTGGRVPTTVEALDRTTPRAAAPIKKNS